MKTSFLLFNYVLSSFVHTKRAIERNIILLFSSNSYFRLLFIEENKEKTIYFFDNSINTRIGSLKSNSCFVFFILIYKSILGTIKLNLPYHVSSFMINIHLVFCSKDRKNPQGVWTSCSYWGYLSDDILFNILFLPSNLLHIIISRCIVSSVDITCLF